MTASLVIVNPGASRLQDPERRTAIVERLTGRLARIDGTDPTVVEAEPDDIDAVVRAALASGAPLVVGVGGDGTLRRIAACLAGTAAPLGIVPAGTGNLMAGSLGVPASMERAIDALDGATTRTIDLARARLTLRDGPDAGGPTHEVETVIAIGGGLGFDARVMATTPTDLKRRLGRAAYFAQAAILAARIEAVPYRITVDGQAIETDASVAMVLNMGALVPGRIAPRLPVLPDDGLLDVVVVGARGPVHGVRVLIDQLWRTHLGGGSGSDTLRVRGRHVAIESERPEPVQVDGDHVGWGTLEALVQPGALRVLVPGGTTAPSDASL